MSRLSSARSAGLLCGACGSGTTTEEFWVCRDCGNRFSVREGKKQVEREKNNAEYYERSRAELAALPEVDRDPEKVDAAYNAALRRQGEAEAAYQKLLDGLKEKGDAAQRRFLRRINGKVYHKILAGFIMVGLVFATPVGAVILGVSIPLGVIYELRQSSAKKALLAGSEEQRGRAARLSACGPGVFSCSARAGAPLRRAWRSCSPTGCSSASASPNPPISGAS